MHFSVVGSKLIGRFTTEYTVDDFDNKGGYKMKKLFQPQSLAEVCNSKYFSYSPIISVYKH